MTDKELVSQLRAQLTTQSRQIKLLDEHVFSWRSQLQSKSRKKDTFYSSIPRSRVLVSKTKNPGVPYGSSEDSLIRFSEGSLRFCYATLPKSSNYNLGLNTFRE